MERHRSLGDASLVGENVCRTHQNRAGRIPRGDAQECDFAVFGALAATEGEVIFSSNHKFTKFNMNSIADREPRRCLSVRGGRHRQSGDGRAEAQQSLHVGVAIKGRTAALVETGHRRCDQGESGS